jgi:type I restriction enzyme M protein
MDDNTGRCAILFPHGVLGRGEEKDLRAKLVQADVIDCVIGIGRNLFYNSPMEACLLICRTKKPAERKGKILFINAVDEVKREKTISTLEEQHIEKIFKAYKEYKNVEGFAKVVLNEDILNNGATLNISQYVSRLEVKDNAPKQSFGELYVEWEQCRSELSKALEHLLNEN